jgi:hypothetical protein
LQVSCKEDASISNQAASSAWLRKACAANGASEAAESQEPIDEKECHQGIVCHCHRNCKNRSSYVKAEGEEDTICVGEQSAAKFQRENIEISAHS